MALKNKKFVAQSASESEEERDKRKNSLETFDSSEEEEDEEMTKEDLEFLKSEGEEEGEEDSGSEDSIASVSPDELSDEDLELIEENLGKRRVGGGSAGSKNGKGKFKRLRRKNEIESEESEEEEASEKQAKKEDSRKRPNELQNLFNDDESEEDVSDEEDDLEDFIEHDEEDGEEDVDGLPESIGAAMKYQRQQPLSTGIPRRRAIVDDREIVGGASKRALSSALASGQISKQAWDEMMEIFGDGTDYLDLVTESGDEEFDSDPINSPKNVDNNKSFNNEMSMIANLEIGSRDIPERFNDLDIKIIDINSEAIGEFESFLQKESNFIAKKIQKLCPTDSFSGLSSAILSVLRFINLHGLEVPFIATYRKEYFSNFFGMNEIWTILDEDYKYRQASQLKIKIKEKLANEELDKMDKEYVLEALENEWYESQLQLIQEYLIRERRRKSLSSAMSGKKNSLLLLEFAHKIVPSASRFAENSRKRRVIHGPLILSEAEMENEAVELIARDVVNNVEGAISGAVSVLAEEYGTNPQLFAEIRDLLVNQVMITVTPTALGSIEISHDPTHYLLPLQYIGDKNVSTFIEDQGLALARGLEAKLITVEFGYGKNFDYLMREMQQYMPGIEKFKKQVFESAWVNHWMPRLNQLVLQRLRFEAETWIAHFSQFYFQEKLMVSPLNLACESRQDDEVAVTSVNFVKETLHIVELDKNGRVLRQEAVKVKHPMRPEAVLQKCVSLRCPFMIISGEGQDCLELYRDLRDSRSFERAAIVWGCDDTAQIYKNSMRASREFPECLVEFKYAIGVGRRMLNPVVEFASMSGDELLQIPLHPLQSHLPRGLRLRHLERALVNVINLLGVAINELILPGTKQAMLSYVSGFGPQSAAQVAKKIGNKWLLSRSELITQYDLGRRMFTNAAGFIRITPERAGKGSGNKKKSAPLQSQLIEPLDGTRIHPESYELARKMAADALELDDPTTMKRRQDIFGDDDDESHDDSDRTASILTTAILQIMKEPKKLDELLLEDYANEIEKLTHLPKLTTLQEIKSELQGPFPDPRSKIDINQLTPINQVIKMLTGKDESWWYHGRPVVVKLLNPTSRKLGSLIEANSLIVGISDDIPRNIRPGTPTNAYLVRIDLNRLIIDVSLKRPANLEELLMKNVNFDPFYNFKRSNQHKQQQQQQQQSNSQSQDSQSAPSVPSTRQLNHPAFRAFNREEAETYLAVSPAGEFLIRPSSQKRVGGEIPGDLTLTWKVGPSLFSHVPLGELDRPSGQDWNLGRTLLLPALIPAPDGKMKIDRFEDLDEIVGRRIEPVVSLLQEAQSCPKYFANPSSDAINIHLRDQTSINPGRIPYCITLATEPHCGHLFLSHPGGNRQELIRVDPRGYALTDPKTKEFKIFERIEKLVDYFKRNYKNFTEKAGREKGKEVDSAAVASSSKQSSSVPPARQDPRTKYQQFAN